MQNIRQMAEAILQREGGYSNDPDDPGGPTNHGVTLQTLRGLGLDLDGNGRVDTADLRQLTKAQAVDIFLKDYYERPQIGRLPSLLQPSVFDMQVNAGSQAVRLLQGLLQRMGYETVIDGAIGPQTAAHTARAMASNARLFVDAYGIERRNYYYRLADTRPASRKFARTRTGGKGGWILRAEEFISPRFHLSDQQHRERTKAWA